MPSSGRTSWRGHAYPGAGAHDQKPRMGRLLRLHLHRQRCQRLGLGSPPAHGPGLVGSGLPSSTSELRVYMTNLCLISRSVKGTQFCCLPGSLCTVPRPQPAHKGMHTHVHTSCVDRRPGVWVRVTRGASECARTWAQFVSPLTDLEWRVWEQAVYLGGDQRRTAAGSRCRGSWRLQWPGDRVLWFITQLRGQRWRSCRDQGMRNKAHTMTGARLHTPAPLGTSAKGPGLCPHEGTSVPPSHQGWTPWGESPSVCSCTRVSVCVSCVYTRV